MINLKNEEYTYDYFTVLVVYASLLEIINMMASYGIITIVYIWDCYYYI